MKLPEGVAQKIGGAKLAQGEGRIEADGVFADCIRVFAIDADGLSRGVVLVGIASGLSWKEGDDAAVLFGSQHCAHGVLVPALGELHRAPHDPGGPQQIFQNVAYVRELLRYLLRFDVVVAQYISDGLLGQMSVIGKTAQNFLAADQVCHLREGVGEHVVVVLDPLSDLFIKPAHVLASYSLRISSSYLPWFDISASWVPRSTILP